jgi:dUTP pyrophosphatase
MLTVAIKRLTPTAILPVKGSQEAACFDLHVDSCTHDAHGWNVHTGLSVALPAGHGMLIYARSGLGTKLGLTLRNGTGVIDSDYRGEIMLKLHHGNAYMGGYRDDIIAALKPGSRIAQAMIIHLPEVILEEVSELPDSIRGAGGFGSTGT